MSTQKDKVQATILIQMAKLHNQVKALAKHPDRPDETFIFAKENALCSKYMRDDNPLAGIFIDFGMGSAFGQFLPDALESIDFGKAVESYEIVQQEKLKDKEKQLAAATANMSHSVLEKSYLEDLPQRIILERQYEALSQKLEENELTFEPQLKNKYEPEDAVLCR